MNYSVLSIPPFDKQLKRLVKKYPSLKKEFAGLLESLENNPNKARRLATTVLKYEYLFPPKAKEKVAGQELLPTLLL